MNMYKREGAPTGIGTPDRATRDDTNRSAINLTNQIIPAKGSTGTLTSESKTAFVVATPVQQAALELSRFNIAPTKPASKEPFLIKALNTTRIVGPEHDLERFLDLFDNGAGILVVTGRLSMNLAIVDAETPECAAFHYGEFQRRDIAPWIVETPSGGAHFWVLVKEGELANRSLTDTGEDWELRANECYCLCPPSLFLKKETGEIGSYNWRAREGNLPPLVSVNDLDWLGAQLAVKQRKQFTPFQADPFAFLSKRNRQTLLESVDNNRNIRLFALACDMNGNNVSFEEAQNFITPVARSVGLDDKEIRKILRNAYSKPREPAKKKLSRVAKSPAWANAFLFAKGHTWKSLDGTRGTVSAQTAKDVFLAMTERARREGKEIFRASIRETAELANVRPVTAHKAIAALVEAKLFESCGNEDRGRGVRGAGRYRIGEAARNTGTVQERGTFSTVPVLRAGYAADVFRASIPGEQQTPGALAWDILREITGQAADANEIAERLHKEPCSIRRSLNKLARWNLATRSREGRWIANAANDETIRGIAASCGTLGKAEARAEKNKQDRARYVTQKLWNAKRFWESKNLYQSRGAA